MEKRITVVSSSRAGNVRDENIQRGDSDVKQSCVPERHVTSQATGRHLCSVAASSPFPRIYSAAPADPAAVGVQDLDDMCHLMRVTGISVGICEYVRATANKNAPFNCRALGTEHNQSA